MAPTTLPGQVTTSSPTGRDVKLHGYPMRMAEIIAGLPGAAYVVRRSVYERAPSARPRRRSSRRSRRSSPAWA